MVGITAYGAYIPFNRLERKRLAEAFGEPAPPGKKRWPIMMRTV